MSSEFDKSIASVLKNVNSQTDINSIRSAINEVDDKILSLFLERMRLSEEVAKYKIANKLPIVNEEREKEILNKVKTNAGECGDYACELFVKLMELSKALQNEIISGDTKK